MPPCASCKNKTSNERCSNSSLAGLIFCGVHSKSKNPRLWSKVNGLDDKSIKIQKLWRGFFVRKRLNLAGPGVLRRSLCNNQDELVSLEPITTIHPFDYFGFEENSKVYGFDIRTIIDALHRTKTNPFTRQPLAIECRRRIHTIYGYRLRRKLDNYYEQTSLKTPEALLENRWTQVSQMIEENGFYSVDPNIFLSLTKLQLFVFLSMILNDLKVWASEHTSSESLRYKYVIWVRNIVNRYHANSNYQLFSHSVASILGVILYDAVDPYTVCFIIMSALYRL